MTPIAIGAAALVLVLAGLAALWLGLSLLRLVLALLAVACLYPCSYTALRGAGLLERVHLPTGDHLRVSAGPAWARRWTMTIYAPCFAGELAFARGIAQAGAGPTAER